MISDEALMLQFQSGSREAFEELFARAEDLTQETFLAVATSRGLWFEPIFMASL
jgi:DNA-directed RNA polymerase specialized sigma24 family protein